MESRGMGRGERRVVGERGEKRDDVHERSALASSGSFAALTFKVLHSLSLCLRLSLSVRYLSTGAPLCAPKHTLTHTYTHTHTPHIHLQPS